MAMACRPARAAAFDGQVRGSRAALAISHPPGTEAGGGALIHWGARAEGPPPPETCPSGAGWVVFRCPPRTGPLTAATASPHFAQEKPVKQDLLTLKYPP